MTTFCNVGYEAEAARTAAATSATTAFASTAEHDEPVRQSTSGVTVATTPFTFGCEAKLARFEGDGPPAAVRMSVFLPSAVGTDTVAFDPTGATPHSSTSGAASARARSTAPDCWPLYGDTFTWNCSAGPTMAATDSGWSSRLLETAVSGPKSDSVTTSSRDS